MKNKNKMITLFWPYISKSVMKPLSKVLASRWIGQGPKVNELEYKFAKMYSIPHVLSVNNCTSAIHLALILSGVKDADEVITTPLTCAATNIPILYQRARPVFADIQKDTLNIDPESVERKITGKTKAIMVVHWSGYPCDMDEISRIAKKHNLAVIEDAAHALGASYHGKYIGSISDYTCFSFQAIKQITSGDGGILTTRLKTAFKRAKLLRWYGINRELGVAKQWKYVKEAGYKYHMNDIAASILIAQLKDLPGLLRRREQIAKFYSENLRNIPGVKLRFQKPDRISGNWLFCLLVEKRADFIRKLKENNIESGPVHLRCDIYPVFGGKRLNLPGMNFVEPKYVSIPLHTRLSDADVGKIVRVIKSGW